MRPRGTQGRGAPVINAEAAEQEENTKLLKPSADVIYADGPHVGA